MTDSATLRQLRLTSDGRLDDCALLDDVALGRLLAMLNQDGEEARVVGGAVRNGLLGLPSGDIDVATTALPETVVARAKAARFRPIPTGIAHGTVTVLVGGRAFEVTTLREDVATDGRHAVVRFGRDFAQDAQRRDFTINALSVSADGTLHDTTDGVADLAAGRVRFIGEADRRIREDYLRILRFFRFSAAYGTGPLDAEGLAAATRHKDSLTRLSRERIRAELLKLLASAQAPDVVGAMNEAGILAVVLGRPCHPDRLARLASIEATRGRPGDALLRLAALAAETAADVRQLRDLLRLSNGEQDRLERAIDARARLRVDSVPGSGELRALLFNCGPQAARDGLDLTASDADPALAAAWAEAYRFTSEALRPKLPLGGAEVMAHGVKNGRLVGAILKRLQADWIRAGFPEDPATLMRLLETAIATETGEPERPAASI